ncbi:hypothetical protein FKM82_015285 [Ascaphus truei]
MGGHNNLTQALFHMGEVKGCRWSPACLPCVGRIVRQLVHKLALAVCPALLHHVHAVDCIRQGIDADEDPAPNPLFLGCDGA